MVSNLSLLFSNLLIVVFAALGWLTASEVLWIYWGQSVIIGLFNIVRILDLEAFTTEGLKSGGRSLPPTEATKREVASFFAIHYGFFHFIYMILLGGLSQNLNIASFKIILINVAVFFVNHLLSYLLHRQADRERVPNIGNMMFSPYMRILPMHLIFFCTPLLAKHSIVLLIIFVLLKTGADVMMHNVEHANRPNKVRKGESTNE